MPPKNDKKRFKPEDILDLIDIYTEKLFDELRATDMRKYRIEGTFVAREEQVFTPDDMFEEDEER